MRNIRNTMSFCFCDARIVLCDCYGHTVLNPLPTTPRRDEVALRSAMRRRELLCKVEEAALSHELRLLQLVLQHLAGSKAVSQ